MARRHSKVFGFVTNTMQSAFDTMSHLMLEKARLPIGDLLVEHFMPHVTAVREMNAAIPEHMQPELTRLFSAYYVKLLVPVFRAETFDALQWQKVTYRDGEYRALSRWDTYYQNSTYKRGNNEQAQVVMLTLNIPAEMIEELTNKQFSYKDLALSSGTDVTVLNWERASTRRRTMFWQVPPGLSTYREEKARYRALARALLKARYLQTFAMSAADYLTTEGNAVCVWPDIAKLRGKMAGVKPTTFPPALNAGMRYADLSRSELERTLAACTDFWLQSQLIDGLPERRITASLCNVDVAFDYGNLD